MSTPTPIPQADAAIIAQTLNLLFAPDDVIEIRALSLRGRNRTDAGYFDGEHRTELIRDAVRLNGKASAVYVNLNPIDPQLLARYANRVQEGANATATDANVTRRRWLLLDFDPFRPKDTSATDLQVEAAHAVARKCYDYLRGESWPEPVCAHSGNGFHLDYPVDLPNNEASRELIKAVLKALATRFDSEGVKVDQSVFNAGRIVKLYGTVANKGDHTKLAPWRLSRIVKAPERDTAVTVEQLAALIPVQSQGSTRTNGASSFDLAGFLSRLNIEYRQDTHEGRERYKLNHCPFNPEHGFGEAAIFRDSAGVLGFRCVHNTCTDKNWQDVRALVDGPRESRTGRTPGVGGTKRKANGGKPKLAVLDATNDALLDVTQDNVALIFAQRHADKFRYSHDRGRWYEWDGKRWREETTRLAFEYTRNLTRSLNTAGKREFSKAAFCEGVEKFAQSDRVFAMRGDEWDQDPWLLNTPGGTVDLRTGRMRAHTQADLITKITAVAPQKGDAPVWLNFLDQVTNGDAPLREFLQRMAGYCLSGDTREECLFFLYGAGGNGKGTFVGAVFNILADFAANATMDTFLSSRHERHSTDLAMLRGSRLVTASETTEGRSWDEQRVKAMTGNDPVTARFMRQDNFTYLPRFKLLLLGNNKPVLRTVDDAWRRRFHIVPFTYTPPKKDLGLKARLVDEYPKILNWMIDGCLLWQSDGLNVPQRVLDETADYFSGQDTFADWMTTCCEVKASFMDTSARLFRSWKAFAEAGGEPVATSKALADRLQQRGFERLPYVPGMGGRGFRGLRTTS